MDKFDKIKLIESLIEQAKKLSFKDKTGLDRFRKRAGMILKNIFEGRRGYSAQMLNIPLYPHYILDSDEKYLAYWKKGRDEILNLLETILEEIELFGDGRVEMVGLSESGKREQFLVKLNELSEGDVIKFINTMSIGDALGFDRATAFKSARYYYQKGYIEHRDDAYGEISITAEGIDEVENIHTRISAPHSDKGGLPLNTAKRDKVFISYSHKDKKLFEEFKTMLAPAIREGIVDLWDDTKIKPGTKWKNEVQAALGSAKVAVLLVSHQFLASDFIAKNELPPLLKAAQDEGVTVFWICLSSCLYEQTEIATYQAAHDVSKPLDQLEKPRRQAVLSEICAKLVQISRNSK